ncbi:MAG: hypothetical protein HZB67_03045 [Candidatus Aenigmarchaeota archaeon]|nr:hypothetical protein [Candidatus Aenigmarchaeota archaeon]
MNISDIGPDSRKINIKAKIIEMQQPREITTRFGKTKVAEAMIEDSTGQFTLVLWGEEVDRVMIGQTIQVENGYIREFQGRLQLNVGKYGKLEVVE